MPSNLRARLPSPMETSSKSPLTRLGCAYPPSPARGEGNVVPDARHCFTSAGSSPLPSRERAGAEGDRVRGLFAEVSHGERERCRSLSRSNSSHGESVAHESLFPRFGITAGLCLPLAMPTVRQLARRRTKSHGADGTILAASACDSRSATATPRVPYP